MIYQDPKEQFARVYQEIEDTINRTVKSLNGINLNNEDGKQLRQDVLNDLENIKNEFCEEFKFLKENSDWDELSIAFFGMTNAGKSTLLETLRILFSEESRKEKIDENLKKLEKMEQEKIQLESIKNKLNELKLNNYPSIEQIKECLEQINIKMQFFPDEYNALRNLSNEKDKKNRKQENEINELYASRTTLSFQKNQLEQEKRRLEDEKRVLEKECNEVAKKYQILSQGKSELDESYKKILVENELLKKKYSKTRVLLIVVFVALVVTGIILC